MRVIKVSSLRTFWQRHPDSEQPLKSWLEEAQKASWKTSADIKAQFRNASIVGNRRVVFNIKGNDYRLIVAVAYLYQAVYIKFVGTHKEYDAIDCGGEPMTTDLILRPIRNDDDYTQALKQAEVFFDAEQEPDPESEAGAYFEALITLIQAWEAKHYPISPPDPIDAIKFRMDQDNLTVKDLEPLIGLRNRVYEVLARKRPLTLAMIRKLHKRFGIPAEVLISQTGPQ